MRSVLTLMRSPVGLKITLLVHVKVFMDEAIGTSERGSELPKHK